MMKLKMTSLRLSSLSLKSPRSFSLLLLWGLFTASLSEAYIPPSFFIVRQLAKRHGEVKQVKLVQRLEFFDGGTTPQSTFTQNIEFDAAAKQRSTGSGFPGRARIIIQDPSGARTIRDRHVARDFPLLLSLQLSPSAAQIFDQLKHSGIPVKSEPSLYGEKDSQHADLPYKPEENLSIMRWQGRIAIVMNSSNDPRTSAPQVWPQLWIEKDTFLPLRAFITSGLGAPEGTPAVELRFSNYQAYQTALLPRTLEGFRDGKLWFRSELVSADLKAKLNFSESSEDHSGSSSDLENYLKWIL